LVPFSDATTGAGVVCGLLTTSLVDLTTSILSLASADGMMMVLAEAVTTLLAAMEAVFSIGRRDFISIPTSRVPSTRCSRARCSNVESWFSHMVVILFSMVDAGTLAASFPNLSNKSRRLIPHKEIVLEV